MVIGQSHTLMEDKYNRTVMIWDFLTDTHYCSKLLTITSVPMSQKTRHRLVSDKHDAHIFLLCINLIMQNRTTSVDV